MKFNRRGFFQWVASVLAISRGSGVRTQVTKYVHAQFPDNTVTVTVSPSIGDYIPCRFVLPQDPNTLIHSTKTYRTGERIEFRGTFRPLGPLEPGEL